MSAGRSTPLFNLERTHFTPEELDFRAVLKGTRNVAQGAGNGFQRGGQNLTRRPPHGNSFRPPLTSVRFAPPPPYSISLSKSLRNAQNFPQLTSETTFRGSRKMVSDGPSSPRFCFSVSFAPPPPLALPSSFLRFLARICGKAPRQGTCRGIWKKKTLCNRILVVCSVVSLRIVNSFLRFSGQS